MPIDEDKDKNKVPSDEGNDKNKPKGNNSKHDMEGRKERSLRNWWGFSPLENIVAFTVAAGSVLMGLSLLVGKPEATKDVLPFATGLIGFLGGLVTSMFRQDRAEKMERSNKNKPPVGDDQNPDPE